MSGEPAPDFSLLANGGGDVSPAELGGRRVVLCFYREDDTSGRTREASDFTALAGEFAAGGGGAGRLARAGGEA